MALWPYSKAFEITVGFWFVVVFFPLLSSMRFSWPSMAVLFQNFLEKSSVLTLFPCRHFSSYSNLLLQNGWLYCKLKNKQVLSGCTLFSLLFIYFPYPVALSPVPSISCLYHQLPFFILTPVLFLQFQSNPNPTHFQSNCH